MRELAKRHRLKYRRAEDGLVIIPGKRGHIGEWGDGRLYWALTFDYAKGPPTARLKEMAKRDPRLKLDVEGDEEAIFTFGPQDLPHAARRWCQARFRRQARPADLANLARARKAPTAGVSHT